MASALASALSVTSSPVTASSSSNVINLTSKVSGSAGNYPLSVSWTYDTGHFSSPSFTGTTSGSSLTGGADCVGAQETYDYNNRLQPVRVQLGTLSNQAADYCVVYNYYGGANPTSCAVPLQGRATTATSPAIGTTIQ